MSSSFPAVGSTESLLELIDPSRMVLWEKAFLTGLGTSAYHTSATRQSELSMWQSVELQHRHHLYQQHQQQQQSVPLPRLPHVVRCDAKEHDGDGGDVGEDLQLFDIRRSGSTPCSQSVASPVESAPPRARPKLLQHSQSGSNLNPMACTPTTNHGGNYPLMSSSSPNVAAAAPSAKQQQQYFSSHHHYGQRPSVTPSTIARQDNNSSNASLGLRGPQVSNRPLGQGFSSRNSSNANLVGIPLTPLRQKYLQGAGVGGSTSNLSSSPATADNTPTLATAAAVGQRSYYSSAQLGMRHSASDSRLGQATLSPTPSPVHPTSRNGRKRDNAFDSFLNETST